MKILHAYNLHRGGGGADNHCNQTIRYSAQRGLQLGIFARDSKALPPGLIGQAQAFFSGIYAPGAVKDFRRVLSDFAPDLVHAHELMPLITPWILPECAKAGVPVVYACYDFRLTCPVFTHFRQGEICHRCADGQEYRAMLHNCRSNYPESLAFALWNAVARHFNLHKTYVSQFVAPSTFVKDWLMAQGISEHRISVVPCAVVMQESPVDPSKGGYIAFAGRFVEEKGVQALIEAARKTGLPVKLAGNFPSHPAIAPGDPVECVDISTPEALAEFYRQARMLVVPSIWYETFGIVAAEAMAHGVPVLASRIGALNGTVVDGVSGLLFEPRNTDELAEKMARLWHDPELLRRLGDGAFKLANERYSPEVCFDRLLTAYDRARINPFPFGN